MQGSLEKLKLSTYQWDSGKHPHGFQSFMEDFGSLVRQINGGDVLEEFLDQKLMRKAAQGKRKPQWLASDPDFQPDDTDGHDFSPPSDGPPADENGERAADSNDRGLTHGTGDRPTYEDARSIGSQNSSSIAVSSIAKRFGAVSWPYRVRDWSSEHGDHIKALDVTLHATLKATIKGPKKAVIADLGVTSYVAAMSALWLQNSVSATNRKLKALESIRKLNYRGDISQWQNHALTSIREFFNSGITLEDIILIAIRDSFDGKVNQMKFEVAKDIDDTTLDKAGMLPDLVQKYATMVASSGNGHAPRQVENIRGQNGKGKGGQGGKGAKGKGGKGNSRNRSNGGKGGDGSSSKSDSKGNPNPKADAPKKTFNIENIMTALETMGSSKKETTGKSVKSSGVGLITTKKGYGEPEGEYTEAACRPDGAHTDSLYKHVLNTMGSSTGVIGLATSTPNEGIIILSLFDGMGGCGLAARHGGIPVKRYFGCESDEDKRTIADYANPKTKSFPGIDRSIGHKVEDIDEGAIVAMGGCDLVTAGWPCKDTSRLRLRGKGGGEESRQGLRGRESGKFEDLKRVWFIVLKVYPNAKHLLENTVFNDLPESWAAVCSIFDEPLIINAKHHSYTHRNRAYWVNVDLSDELFDDMPPLDPNMCLEQGRTFDLKNGITTVTASWKGDPNRPWQHTSRPIMINDDSYEEWQSITATEAERLHHIPEGSTAAPGVTEAQRLKAIGDGWDISIVARILQGMYADNPMENFISLIKEPITHDLTDEEEQITELLWSMDEAARGDLIANHIGDPEEQVHYLRLIYHKSKSESSAMVGAIKEGYTVLDSGASVHVAPKVNNVDRDDVMQLIGYNGKASWTTGTGDVPQPWRDQHTGKSIKYSLQGVNECEKVTHTIASMGKLLREGFQFIFTSPEDMIGITPDEKHTFACMLGEDDLVLIPTGSTVNAVSRQVHNPTGDFFHQTLNHASAERIKRTLEHTTGYKPIPALKVPKCEGCAQGDSRRHGLSSKRSKPPARVQMARTCSTEDEEYDESDEEEAYTDPDTADRYATEDMPDLPSDENTEDEEYDTYSTSSDDESDEADPTQVVARRQPKPHAPRFNLETLRPWEVHFCDNKEFGHRAYGDPSHAFLVVDMATRMAHVVDVKRKSDNGKAVKSVWAYEGVLTLPYHCTCYADGCGSMRHVEQACHSSARIRFEPTPPHEQSLNEAENLCDQLWATARSMILARGAPSTVENFAVKYAGYVHNRMSTTESRGWKTPLELCTGEKPDISHLRPFWSVCYVHVPKSKRAALKRRGLGHIRGERGRFVGFHSPRSTTYAVLLDNGHLVHSKNVEFDDEPTHYGAIRDPYTTPHGDDGDGITSDLDVALDLQLDLEHTHDARLKGVSHDIDTHGDEGYDPVYSPCVYEPNAARMTPEDDDPATPQDDLTMGPWDVVVDVDMPREWHLDPTQDVGIHGTPPGTSPPWRTHDAITEGMTRTRSGKVDLITVIEDEVGHPDPSRFVLSTTLDKLARLDSKIEADLERHEALIARCFKILDSRPSPDVAAYTHAAHVLAVQAQHDISWKKTLSGPHREEAIKALEAELASLTNTILERVTPESHDWAEAQTHAVTGRILLDVKRSGAFKARGVKQGFKECRATADGPDFNYYSHVAKLQSVRTALFREHRRNRRVALKDVATAYLQSISYDGFVKYVCFQHPVTKEWMYFRQHGPIYGEASAAVRWENTIGPWFEEQGFVRGSNERCVFYHEERDLIVLLYVDDVYADGDEDDIAWIFDLLDSRFTCKPAEWLTEATPLDYLGQEVILTDTHIHLSMYSYIQDMVDSLELRSARSATTPIATAVNPNTAPLDQPHRKLFMVIMGCVGWLVNTARPDVAYAHSRVAQHMASPTVSALDAAKRIVRYLKRTAHLTLAAPIGDPNLDTVVGDERGAWSFFSDTDHAGNAEIQNKRRSQNGLIAIQNGAPVVWASKVSSVAFAHPALEEAHADVSSAAVEIFGSANATHEFLYQSYVADEMGVDFPLPIRMQIDNSACETFINASGGRSKLKHIDCRQWWVEMLRDKNVLIPTHVDSKYNVADLFTKILAREVFERLRDVIMVPFDKTMDPRTVLDASDDED